MVRGLLAQSRVGFLETVLFNAATIGLGGWTGTILCSPTILGKTSGLHGRWARGGKAAAENAKRKQQEPLLHF